MMLPRPFYYWLLVLSSAVSAFRFRQSCSYGTLVPRGGPEPFHGGGDPSRPWTAGRGPSFPAVAAEQAERIYEVDWETSIHTLNLHYRPWDENDEPIDNGLEVRFQYDATQDIISLHFAAPNDPNVLQEGTYLREHGDILYRIPNYDGVRRSQRYIFLPENIDEQTAREAIRLGNDHLDTFIRQFVRQPDRQPYAMVLANHMRGYATSLSRLQYRWLATQLSGALARGRYRDATTKRKREKALKERRIQERANTLGTINEQVSQPGQNSTADQSAKFQTTLNIYTALLSNITTLLFPVLNELIDNSTNPILYQMAISIYADITMVPQQIAGPFKNGMTAFTDIEDQYLNKTNTKVSSNGTIENSANQTDILYMLAYHGLYEKVYLSTWDKAINATNSTGLLSLLYKMSGYILPADPSIAPPGWLDTPMSFLNSSADIQDIIKYANITQL